MRFFILALGLVIGFSASFGYAQGTLTYSDQLARAEARYFSPGPVGNLGLTPDLTGVDFNATEDHSFTGGGFSGRGFAEHAITFTPPNPGINGSFSSAVLEACTSAEVSASNLQLPGPHTSEVAHGRASGLIKFNLSAPMIWTWDGVSQGNSYNTGSYNSVAAVFTLTDLNFPFTQYVNMTNVSINGVGDFYIPFSLGGLLQPGDYRLTWSHESLVTGGNTPYGYFPTAVGGAPLVSCIPSIFTLVPEPGTATLLALGGIAVIRRSRATHSPRMQQGAKGVGSLLRPPHRPAGGVARDRHLFPVPLTSRFCI